ncbi:MAG: heparinase II/III domain-containing protein, partial [Halanaerobiales bacterium]
ALIFPVTTCNYRDFRPVLNTIYALFKGKRLYEQGNYDEEILWFSDINLETISHAKIQRQSVDYNKSGFYSLRHDDGHLMIIIQDFKTRPAQMDQMHIDLWHKGVNVLCDSGTYSYASDLGRKMALTAAHNTVKVVGKEQMKKHGPFLIYNWTRSKDVVFSDNYFKGTMISKNGYSHIRSINKNTDGYTIIDQLVGDCKNYKILFHTPCVVKKNENGLDLFLNNKIVTKIITDEEIQINDCYRSLFYLEKEEISQISVGNKTNSNTKVKVVLK